MNLAVLTALWGRPRLSNMVMRYYEQMPGIDLRVCVCSPEDAEENAFQYGHWTPVPFPNEPLSDKWNAGMAALRSLDPDAVMIVGSDDLVTPGYVLACRYLIEHGADLVYLPGAYFFDACTGRMIRGYAERLGLGRFVSRRLLDAVDWRPWPSGLTHGLDGAMWEHLVADSDGLFSVARAVRLDDCFNHGMIGLDIKTGHNMWDFDHIRDFVISVDVPAARVIREHFPAVADELLNWNEPSSYDHAQTPARIIYSGASKTSSILSWTMRPLKG